MIDGTGYLANGTFNITGENLMDQLDHLKPGARVPSVIFRIRKNDKWEDLPSNEIFEQKTVVVFALPGAFTPTCSRTHLPGYMALSDQLKKAGADDIYCLSVNDSFVMNAWAKDQRVEDKIVMLPDGNGTFTDLMGMLVDKNELGFGRRSWRYSMLVYDSVIHKMFVEDFSTPGDPFEVSDASTMLDAMSVTSTETP